MSATDTVKNAVAKHPRMIGFLFAVMAFLAQSGSAAAGSWSQVGP